jgi:outer membrane protein assembly factor BamB
MASEDRRRPYALYIPAIAHALEGGVMLRRIRAAAPSLLAAFVTLTTITGIPAPSSATPAGSTQPMRAEPWPQFHGTLDNRGFNRHEHTVGAKNVSSLSLSWIGNGATNEDDLVFDSSPVVGGGLVFFGTNIGQVLAFSQSGCGGSECAPVWRARLQQGIYSTLALSNGVLYATANSPEGGLFAFTAAGCGHRICEPVWSVPMFGTSSPPKVSGGVVYVGTWDGVLAIDANGCGRKTCKPMWTGGTAEAVEDAAAIVDGVVYVGSTDGRLSAFDAAGCGAKRCDPLWTGQTGGSIYSSSPAVANGFVYISSFEDGRVNVFPQGGCGHPTCDPLWKGDADQYVDSSPAVAYGRVYVGTGHAELRVFDANGCGKKLCQPEWIGMPAGPGAAMNGAPMVANGVVYVGENNERIYAFRAKGCGKTLCDALWEHITQDPIVNSSPAIVNGTLYVSGSNFGAVPELYVFTLPGLG